MENAPETAAVEAEAVETTTTNANDLLKDAIDAAMAAGPAEAPQVQAESAPEAQPEPAKAEEPAQAEPQGNLPAIKRLMELEADKRKFEEERKAFEADKKAATEALAKAQTSERKLEAEKSRFRLNRLAYLKTLDPDLDAVSLARELYYSSLGEAAPVEYKASRESSDIRSEVDRLKAELEQHRNSVEAERNRQDQEVAYQKYRGSLNSFAAAIPAEMPLVRKLATKDSGWVATKLYEIAAQHAARTNGAEILSAEEAAKVYEYSLQKDKELYQELYAPESKPASTPQATKTSSLRNSHTTVQASLTHKAPSEEALLKDAIAAAMGTST